jgi:hypothetical protein
MTMKVERRCSRLPASRGAFGGLRLPELRLAELRLALADCGLGVWGEGMPDFAHNFDLTNEFNILRLACGLFLIPHFWLKAKDIPQTVEEVYKAWRLFPPKAWIYTGMLVEVICAVGLTFGIYTRCRSARGGVPAGRRLGVLARERRQMDLEFHRRRISAVLGDLLHRRRHARLIKKESS